MRPKSAPTVIAIPRIISMSSNAISFLMGAGTNFSARTCNIQGILDEILLILADAGKRR
jgi:hypothetical protein